MKSSRRSFFSLFAGGVAVAAVAQVKATPVKVEPVEYDFGGSPFPPPGFTRVFDHQHPFGTENANHTHQLFSAGTWNGPLPKLHGC